MKTRFLITGLILAGVFGTAFAVPPVNYEQNFRHSEIVIEGKILSVDIISEPVIYKTVDTYSEQSGIAVYDVQVEKSLKNPDNEKTITVTGYFLREPHPMAYETHPYEVGQTLLLYLQENTNGETDTDLILLSSTSKIIDDYMRPNNFYYKFVGFQYANILGEPIKFVLERIGQNNCYPYDVEIIDDHGNLVVGFGTESSCSQNEDPVFVSSKIEIGYNKDRPIIIEEPGNYTIKVNVDGISIEKEFAVRKNFSGVTLDRTFYPVLWADSPLRQFKSGVSIDDIQCKDGMVLLKKHSGSPACVKPDSVVDLIKRNWLTTEEIDGYAIDYGDFVKHLGFADICTNEMKIILLTHSNIASPEEEFLMEDVGLPSGMNQEDFENCAVATGFTKERWNVAPR